MNPKTEKKGKNMNRQFTQDAPNMKNEPGYDST